MRGGAPCTWTGALGSEQARGAIGAPASTIRDHTKQRVVSSSLTCVRARHVPWPEWCAVVRSTVRAHRALHLRGGGAHRACAAFVAHVVADEAHRAHKLEPPREVDDRARRREGLAGGRAALRVGQGGHRAEEEPQALLVLHEHLRRRLAVAVGAAEGVGRCEQLAPLASEQVDLEEACERIAHLQ